MTPKAFPELRFFRHISVDILLFVVCVLAVPIAVYGQDSAPTTASTSVPVPDAGHGYIGQANETVSPANGSVSIRIPLALPAGRKLTLHLPLAMIPVRSPLRKPARVAQDSRSGGCRVDPILKGDGLTAYLGL